MSKQNPTAEEMRAARDNSLNGQPKASPVEILEMKLRHAYEGMQKGLATDTRVAVFFNSNKELYAAEPEIRKAFPSYYVDIHPKNRSAALPEGKATLFLEWGALALIAENQK